MNTPIIVTGAHGWIGQRVCMDLRAEGHSVIAVDGGPTSKGPWDEYVRADAAEAAFPARGGEGPLRGAAGLVHCAFFRPGPVETAAQKARCFAVNRDGSGHVVELAKRAGVERIVFAGTAHVYRRDTPAAVDEAQVVEGATAYAASMLAGERLFRESGLDGRAVRLATLFGEGDRGGFATLARALARRRFALPGGGRARKSVAPAGVASTVLARLAVEADPAHRLLNVALPEAPSLREICDAFAAACNFGRPPRVPYTVLWLAALLGNAVAKLRPGCQLTTTNLRRLAAPAVVDTTRFRAACPDLAHGTFREALESCAGYYRWIGTLR